MIKSIKNRKKDNEKGLQGVFYIIDKSKNEKDQWWQLRLVSNHYVVSAVGSYDHILECLETVCRRYKTYKGLMKAFKHCEHFLSEEDKKKMDKEYASLGSVFSDEVEEIVSRVEHSRQEVTKKKPLFNRVNKVAPTTIAPPVVEEEPTIVKPVVKKKPLTKLLKKR
jgi:hypothetical protein